MSLHVKIQEKRAKCALRPVKDFVFDVKDLEIDLTKRTVKGYAAVFGNIDGARDMIIKGAFAKSISERGPGSANNSIIFLWQHDMKDPIGRITKLAEDAKGLYFEAVIDEIEQGDRAVTQLQSGTLKQFSIGFNYVWDMVEYDLDQDCFICKEIYLAEISVVSLSCNDEATLVGMKGEDIEDAQAIARADFETICKKLRMPDAYALKASVDKLIALASARPVEATKQELRAASKAETPPGLNWGALSNAIN